MVLPSFWWYSKYHIFLPDQNFKKWKISEKKSKSRFFFFAIQKFIMHPLTQSCGFWIKPTSRKKSSKLINTKNIETLCKTAFEQELTISLANQCRNPWKLWDFNLCPNQNLNLGLCLGRPNNTLLYSEKKYFRDFIFLRKLFTFRIFVEQKKK